MNHHLMPLSVIPKGQKAIIQELRGGVKFKNKMADMGIFPGTEITTSGNPENGFVILQSSNSRIGIGIGMAHKIFVELI